VTRTVFTTKKLIFAQRGESATMAIILVMLYEVGTKFSQYSHSSKHI